MPYLAIDKNKTECIFDDIPTRQEYTHEWINIPSLGKYFILPNGSIEKLTGKKLTWKDEPIEI